MAVKNGQSIETGNIGYTIHRTKTNRAKQRGKIQHKTKKDEQHGHHQNPGDEPRLPRIWVSANQ